MNHASSASSLSNAVDPLRLAAVEGWVSLLVNALLFALKLWVGVVTGSVALVADAWHTLSDSFSSAALVAGAHAARRPPDEKHPFGHGRYELIVSLVIGLALVWIAVGFAREGIERLRCAVPVRFGLAAVIVTTVSLLVKEALARFAFSLYRRTGSPALKADGWHHRSDAVSSALILVGIAVARYAWWGDAVLGIGIAALLLVSAWDILRDTINPLLGESPPADLVARINELARDATRDEPGIHHIHLHRYGTHREVTFHMRLPGEMSIAQGHGIATRIEQRLRQELKMEATIHVELAPDR